MLKKLLLAICAFLPLAGSAQINLIQNPSFEDYSHCPDNYDEAKYAYPWMSLDTTWNPPDWAHAIFGVPDLCNVCAHRISSVSIPFGTYYYHYPRTGKGFMEVQMFNDEGYVCNCQQNYRDYLQQRLSRNLMAGKTYQVFFYTSIGTGSYYAVNRIGAYFDDGTIDTTHLPGSIQNQFTPQIVENSIINDSALSDTNTWIRVGGTFTAAGTESFITIGQFTDRAHTNYVAIQDTTGSYIFGHTSLYLIDDVSVIDCSNIPFAGNDTLIRPGDSAFLGPHEILLPYTWYTMGSAAAFDSGGGVWVHPTHTTTYVLKQDLCGEPKFDTVVVHVWPDTVAHVNGIAPITAPEVVLYPNPVTSVLSIDGAVGCNVLVYNMLGELVHEKEIPDNYRSQHESMDMGALLPGVYSVVVVDRVTGYRVTKRVQKE